MKDRIHKKLLKSGVLRRLLLLGMLSSFYLVQAQTTIFLTPQDINKRNGLKILTSGTYVLTDDVFFTQVSATAITISTDDVTIDLNGKTLRSSSPSGENTAIHISGPAVKNVTIRNGKIAAFNVFSVQVDAGATAINIEDLGVISSNIRGATALTPTGIGLEGTPLSTTRTTDVVINNCTVNNSRFGLRARAADAVRVTNSTFNSNGSRGISAFDCDLWEVVNCQAANQKVNDELGNFGLLGLGCSSWRMKNCDFSFNRITAAIQGSLFPSVGGAQFQAVVDAGGIILKGSGSHIIEDCTFCNNSSTVAGSGSLGRGLALVLSGSCVVRNCVANGNSSIDTLQAGFLDAGSSGNLYENCVAEGNLIGQSTVSFGSFGFMSFSSVGTCFIKCTSIRNQAMVGAGVGFFVGFGATDCLVQNCLAVANSQEGFTSIAATTVYIGNLAFANPFNYLAFLPGVIGFITVVNGVQPPAGTFDERQIDNISII